MFFANAWRWYGRSSQPAGWHVGWSRLLRQFDRGVLTAVTIPGELAHMVADLRGLFTSEPIETILFNGAGARAAHLQAVSRLAVSPRPVRLAFRPTHGSGDSVGYLVSALGSPLSLAAVKVEAAACAAGSALALVVARSPFLTNVTELALDSNRMDLVAAMMLANSPGLHKVERVTATRNEFGPQGEDLLLARFGNRLLI